jgi:hypothetical protein
MKIIWFMLDTSKLVIISPLEKLVRLFSPYYQNLLQSTIRADHTIQPLLPLHLMAKLFKKIFN